MSRLSRFVAVDDFPIAEKDNDHRIKMYKGLRRGGPRVAKGGLPALGSISPDGVTPAVSATGGGEGPKAESP
jgi:hypothetical protein